MSIASVTRRHTVTVLNPSETVGIEMGSNQTWAAASPAVTLTCTLVPFNSTDPEQLMQRQAVIPFTVYFAADPNLNENHRLLRNTITARLTGSIRNAHGQGRLWIMRGEVLREDNPTRVLDRFFDA